jgi:ABC-type multidrug transport system fused ATPase/permease subunit
VFEMSIKHISINTNKLAFDRACLLFIATVSGIMLLGILLLLGHQRIVAGSMTPGIFSSFTFFLLLAGGSTATLGNLWSGTRDAAAALERIMFHFGDHVAPIVAPAASRTKAAGPNLTEAHSIT